eukprot:gb/GECG01006388.1/.p1 GENE.gb/GECG01006388.1/~~gb/GECG01006388.1/.p1  ORF type:complete len:280 (+),score=47.61 gb/GECG01006388.1/:1-840(+)
MSCCSKDTESSSSKGCCQIAKVKQPAPTFEADALVNGEFKKVKLSEYKGKYVVLFFYPLDFTFVCPTEIISFSDRVKEFQDINTEVLACSVDSTASHLAWTNQDRKNGGLGKMNIPLLSDATKSISTSYGVYVHDGPDAGVALRGLFIIDGKGVLRQSTINDLPVGRDVDETLRLVKAFQFTDEHGEVCPAGWKPGKKSMKADPKGSLEYFGAGETEDMSAKKQEGETASAEQATATASDTATASAAATASSEQASEAQTTTTSATSTEASSATADASQ